MIFIGSKLKWWWWKVLQKMSSRERFWMYWNVTWTTKHVTKSYLSHIFKTVNLQNSWIVNSTMFERIFHLFRLVNTFCFFMKLLLRFHQEQFVKQYFYWIISFFFCYQRRSTNICNMSVYLISLITYGYQHEWLWPTNFFLHTFDENMVGYHYLSFKFQIKKKLKVSQV